MATVSKMKNGIRNSKMFLNEVYFWTDTIKDWKTLLVHDKCKEIITDSWRTLTQRRKVAVYGFVIMPNHLHVIWEMLSLNGKEMPYASFNKFTSHQFLEYLRRESREILTEYGVIDSERNHRFWQRDPLAVNMDSQAKMEQKLEYIHTNPLQERWNLVSHPEDYYWSSAKFYEHGLDDFGFLAHYRDRF